MDGKAAASATLVGRLERLPFSRWHRNFFILCFLGIMFDAADFALFGAALPPIAREFGLGPAQAGLLATVGLVGAFLGALFWGTISDYIGRRTSFLATVSIFALFTALVAASWNVLVLAVFRFLSNFGLGGEVPVTLTLASEFSPGRIRGRMTGSMMAAFPVGLVVAAALSLAIVPTLGLAGAVRRRRRAGGAVVLRAPLHAGVGALPVEPRRDRSRRTHGREIERQAQAEPGVAAAQPLGVADETGVAARGVTVLALFEDGRARRTILLWIVSFCFLWSSNGILFMLPTILTQRGFGLSQAISFQLVQSLAAVVGYTACGFLIDWYGRRPVLFLYYFIGALFHLWFAQATGFAMYLAIAAVGWVNPGVFGATGIYVSELHPTYLRATAVGWFFGIGRIGSFLAPLIVGLMLQYGLGAYVLHTFALTFLIAAIALWLVGVETKGLVLEQITAKVKPA